MQHPFSYLSSRFVHQLSAQSLFEEVLLLVLLLPRPVPTPPPARRPPPAAHELCNGFVAQVYLCISVGDASSARSLYRVSWIDRTGRNRGCYSTFKPLLSIEIRVCLATTLTRLYGRDYYFLFLVPIGLIFQTC